MKISNLTLNFNKPKINSQATYESKTELQKSESNMLDHTYMSKELLNISFKGQMQGPKTQLSLKQTETKFAMEMAKILAEENKDEKLDLTQDLFEHALEEVDKWGSDNKGLATDEEREFIADYRHEVNNDYTVPLVKYLQSEDESISSITKLALNIFKPIQKTIQRYNFFLEEDLVSKNKKLPVIMNLILDAQKDTLEKKNITLEIEGKEFLDDNSIKLGLTGYKAYTVLRNVTQNASKYSPENSTIKLKLELDKENSLLNVSVEDQGIGIKDEDKETVKQGKRASNAIKSNIPGTGRGLRRVNIILDEMGQKLKIESPVNYQNEEFPGTRMSFNLPISIED